MQRFPSFLVVCTGNTCRSPVAAALLESAAPGARTTSAGTAASIGSPVDPTMARVAQRQAAQLTHHVAEQINDAAVRGADLVITMTRAHRSEVVTRDPSALRRAFTLREIARLLPDVARDNPRDGRSPGQWLADLAPGMIKARHANPAGPEADDIADPYGGPLSGFERAYKEIFDAAAAIARVLNV